MPSLWLHGNVPRLIVASRCDSIGGASPRFSIKARGFTWSLGPCGPHAGNLRVVSTLTARPVAVEWESLRRMQLEGRHEVRLASWALIPAEGRCAHVSVPMQRFESRLIVPLDRWTLEFIHATDAVAGGQPKSLVRRGSLAPYSLSTANAVPTSGVPTEEERAGHRSAGPSMAQGSHGLTGGPSWRIAHPSSPPPSFCLAFRAWPYSPDGSDWL